jgi:hypothetical protein
VELFECLDAVERDAAGALDRDRQPLLFDRLSWYRLLQAHCPPPGRLLVARSEDDRGARSWLFLAVSGRHATSFANWYTLRLSLPPTEALTSIATALHRAGIVRLTVAPLPLRAAPALARWWTAAESTGMNWVADTAGLSFDDYWASRPAKLRNTAERKARSAGLESKVYRAFDAEAWNDYQAVYRSSWKPDEGSPAFLRALAEQEGAAGTLRLGIARKDGRPVAAQLWLVENGRATIHKLAYANEAKRHSPGTILSTAMFRHVIDEDRVNLIDFGLGDEPYKADWMDRAEPIGRLSAFSKLSFPGTVGAARALVRRLRSD